MAKWVPPLRYAKDIYGGSLQHSGPNRRDRRQRAAYYRTGKKFLMADGRLMTGERERSKARRRHRVLVKVYNVRPLRNRI